MRRVLAAVLRLVAEACCAFALAFRRVAVTWLEPAAPVLLLVDGPPFSHCRASRTSVKLLN